MKTKEMIRRWKVAKTNAEGTMNRYRGENEEEETTQGPASLSARGPLESHTGPRIGEESIISGVNHNPSQEVSEHQFVSWL
ncbi:hypothetical protein RRG08_047136 [Elysia crispata]|uniref:Uncharacterized protein n=1 Tax=Elysia crispata TaxID=231223 RepID=A0AAE1AP07_9GAST|nr:hypothetical protein RRG08_047136 [Elysia crispata]